MNPNNVISLGSKEKELPLLQLVFVVAPFLFFFLFIIIVTESRFGQRLRLLHVVVLLPMLGILPITIRGIAAHWLPRDPPMLPDNPLEMRLGLLQLISLPLWAPLPLKIQPPAGHPGIWIIQGQIKRHHDQQRLHGVVRLIPEGSPGVDQRLQADGPSPRHVARVPLKPGGNHPEERGLCGVIGREEDLQADENPS